MTRTLNEKALTMLADIPPYLAADPSVQTVAQACGAELQRVEDAATAIQQAMFPAQATDQPILNGVWTAPILSMWETMLNLPVAPAGVTTADRQAKVKAHIGKRQSGAGSDWVATLSQAFGPSIPWSYEEGPGDYQVTIFIPYSAGSYTAGQVLALAAQITPAHIQIAASYDQGWLADVSEADVDVIF